MDKKDVTIYSTPSCHFCHMAREYFKEHNVEFTDHDVAEDAERRNEMIQKSGQMGVPVIIIKDSTGEGQEEMIIGFNQDKLQEALGI